MTASRVAPSGNCSLKRARNFGLEEAILLCVTREFAATQVARFPSPIEGMAQELTVLKECVKRVFQVHCHYEQPLVTPQLEQT
jgi:hypothetical protein